MLAAISSLVIAGVGTAAVRADINNPGQVRIDDSKVIINIGAGKDGKDGADGAPGKDGVNGTNGVDGQNGRDGVNGTNGVDGQNGRDGVNGTNGVDGKDGMNATATVLINSTNGQQTQCTVSPPSTVNCVELPVVVPPIVCEPPAVLNATTNECETPIVIPPIDNNTNSTG